MTLFKFIHCSGVSNVDFEKVNAGWVREKFILFWLKANWYTDKPIRLHVKSNRKRNRTLSDIYDEAYFGENS